MRRRLLPRPKQPKLRNLQQLQQYLKLQQNLRPKLLQPQDLQKRTGHRICDTRQIRLQPKQPLHILKKTELQTSVIKKTSNNNLKSNPHENSILFSRPVISICHGICRTAFFKYGGASSGASFSSLPSISRSPELPTQTLSKA